MGGRANALDAPQLALQAGDGQRLGVAATGGGLRSAADRGEHEHCEPRPHGFKAARVSGVFASVTRGSVSGPVMLKLRAPARMRFRFRTRPSDAVPLT